MVNRDDLQQDNFRIGDSEPEFFPKKTKNGANRIPLPTEATAGLWHKARGLQFLGALYLFRLRAPGGARYHSSSEASTIIEATALDTSGLKPRYSWYAEALRCPARGS